MRMTTARRNGRQPATTDDRAALLRTAGVAAAGAATGAVAEYLLDPNRGRSRRAKVRDQVAHAVHEGDEGLDALSRDLANRGRGLVASMRYRLAWRSVDDRVLIERVRATLGRYVRHPHAVEVDAADGLVILNGDVLADEAGRARRAVARVPGVRQVEARWNVHRDPTGVPQLQGTRRRRGPVPELRQQHWSPSARLLAGSGGLALWSMSRWLPRPAAWMVGGTGAVLAARAATNLPLRRLTGITAGPRAVDVQDSIVVAATPDRVWSLLSDYTTFPRFMPDVLDVRRSPDGRWSHWMIAGPVGMPIRFGAEETRRADGREIAWRTVDGQRIAHTGVLRLDPEADSRTRVQVRLAYNPMAGAVGHAVARAVGADPGRKLQHDLRRIKWLVEAGASPADAARSGAEQPRAW